jgi:DNA repair photolyase
MRTLVDAGIKAGVALAPLLPGLSDTPESMLEVLRRARDAGACHAWMNTLNLRPGVREHFLEALARDYPDQVERYVELYRRAYLDRDYTEAVRAEKRLADRAVGGIRDRRPNPILPELQLSLL